MATEKKSTEETKKMMTVKEIISSRLKAREERNQAIMKFYDELIKESLQEVDDSVFKRGENIIDLILITDEKKKKMVCAFINDKVLFVDEEYQRPSEGFEAFKKMFESEDGFKGVTELGSEVCQKKGILEKSSTAKGYSYSFKI